VKWRLVITPVAQAALRIYSPETKQYIRAGLDEILDNPKIGKKLKDDLAGFFSYRVRRFRIIYQLQQHLVTIVVIAVGPGKTIYHDLVSDIHAS
jgi:mRNA-degrading endonuclease RelE of RelBE toxin-antitoxin system